MRHWDVYRSDKWRKNNFGYITRHIDNRKHLNVSSINNFDWVCLVKTKWWNSKKVFWWSEPQCDENWPTFISLTKKGLALFYPIANICWLLNWNQIRINRNNSTMSCLGSHHFFSPFDSSQQWKKVFRSRRPRVLIDEYTGWERWRRKKKLLQIYLNGFSAAIAFSFRYNHQRNDISEKSADSIARKTYNRFKLINDWNRFVIHVTRLNLEIFFHVLAALVFSTGLLNVDFLISFHSNCYGVPKAKKNN